MPVGVPFVEYPLPSDSDDNEDGEEEQQQEPEWVNLYNALYRERMLFLCQELEDTIANELIGLMLYLNGEDPERAFFMFINSPGGSVTCGIGIYDIMRYLNSGITTICMGSAASMASFILAGGTSGRRIALPSSRIMIHQPEGGSDGQATEIFSESIEVTRIRRQVGLIYANRTQQSIERIAQDLDRDQYMSAHEARQYGLVDLVARYTDERYEEMTAEVLGISPDRYGLKPGPDIPDIFRKLALVPELVKEQKKARMRSTKREKVVSALPALFPVEVRNAQENPERPYILPGLPVPAGNEGAEFLPTFVWEPDLPWDADEFFKDLTPYAYKGEYYPDILKKPRDFMADEATKLTAQYYLSLRGKENPGLAFIREDLRKPVVRVSLRLLHVLPRSLASRSAAYRFFQGWKDYEEKSKLRGQRRTVYAQSLARKIDPLTIGNPPKSPEVTTGTKA